MPGPMIDLGAVLDRVIDQLNQYQDATTGGRIAPATDDPGLLRPPGVFVRLGPIVSWTLGGVAEVRVDIYLVAPDTTPAQINRTLSELLDLAMQTWTPDLSIGPVTPVGLVLPDNPAPLPALHYTIGIATP